jgi:hypothetical protein
MWLVHVKNILKEMLLWLHTLLHLNHSGGFLGTIAAAFAFASSTIRLCFQGTIVAAFAFGLADGDLLRMATSNLPVSLDASAYPADTICRLHCATVNPIFAARSSELLLHALVTCGHSLALMPVPCGKVCKLLNFLWVQNFVRIFP